MPHKVGVFDSGVGGLTVLRQLLAVAPGATYCYLGDTARVPYGSRSAATVIDYSLSCARHLEAMGAEIIVIACNTSSALALQIISSEVKVPVVGIIEDGVTAVMDCGARRVMVLGTRATISSGTYGMELARRLSDPVITSVACPLFVPIVEEGLADSMVASSIIQLYLGSVDLDKIDAVLLACTHFPILSKSLSAQLPAHVPIVDPSANVARRVRSMLSSSGWNGRGEVNFHVTDAPEGFCRVASAMGIDIQGSVRHVSI